MSKKRTLDAFFAPASKRTRDEGPTTNEPDEDVGNFKPYMFASSKTLITP
jgi:hypothetical protein